MLKELKLANENGYECTFIGFKLGNWSDKTENDHLKLLKNVKTYYLSAGISTSLNVQVRWWLSIVEAKYLSTLIWKLSIAFNWFSPKNLKISAFAHNKRTWQICKKLKTEKDNYDLIVAHNLGALYPSYKLAKRLNTPFAFDIEDFHPGEKCSLAEKNRREFLMQKLLPKAAYISYASPLIGQYSFDLIKNSGRSEQASFPAGKGREVRVLVNNSFSQPEFEFKECKKEKVQFVWFSQNIAAGRGLELVIPALAKYKNKVQLTLIGNLYPEFKNSFLKDYSDFIIIQPPLPQKELNFYLCEFDVGLAIELSSADLNRDICLTNKIFAYIQAGLLILATDTSAQKQFINEHNKAFDLGSLQLRSATAAQPPIEGSLSEAEMSHGQSPISIGILSGQSTEEMEQVVSEIIENIENVRANKKARFEYAKQLAWENEGEKLLDVWIKVLSSRF